MDFIIFCVFYFTLLAISAGVGWHLVRQGDGLRRPAGLLTMILWGAAGFVTSVVDRKSVV